MPPNFGIEYDENNAPDFQSLLAQSSQEPASVSGTSFSGGGPSAVPTPQGGPSLDDLLASIQKHRDELSQGQQALLNRGPTQAQEIPYSREQMLGAALQAILPVIGGIASGNPTGGLAGAKLADAGLSDYLGGIHKDNALESERQDKTNEFVLKEKGDQLDREEQRALLERRHDQSLSDAQTKSDIDLTKQKELISYKADNTPKKDTTTKDENDLAKRVDALPDIKMYAQMRRIRDGAIRAAKEKDNAVSSLSLLESLAQSFNPGYSVRDFAYEAARDAASPYQKIMGDWEKVKGGGFLTPDRKQQILDTIDGKFRAAEFNATESLKTISKAAKDRGLDMSHIYIPPELSGEQNSASSGVPDVLKSAPQGMSREQFNSWLASQKGQ